MDNRIELDVAESFVFAGGREFGAAGAYRRIKGRARFQFRHIDTGETHELITEGGDARIVETIPGWTHNISNIGDEEMIVMLWANEIFDRSRPDTIAMKVNP